jgi:hypothetical protein
VVIDDNGHGKILALLICKVRVVRHDLGHRAFIAAVTNPTRDEFTNSRLERRLERPVACRFQLMGFLRPATSALDNDRKLGVGMELQRHQQIIGPVH